MRGLFLTLFFMCIALATTTAQNAATASWDTSNMRSVCNLAGASLDLKPQVTDSLSRLLYVKAKEKNNIDFTGKAASLISITEVKLNTAPSMGWYDTAMYYLSQTRNHKWIAYTNLQIGYALGEKFQFQSGIRHLLKATENYAAANDDGMLITTYTAISNMFHDFGDFGSEIKYAKMAVALVEKINDKNLSRRWGAYALLGISYEDNHEFDKALSTHMHNISNADNDWVLFLSYNNVGVTLRKKNDYQASENYFLKALACAKKINDDNSFAAVYDNLSRVQIQFHNYAKAKQYLDLALNYARKNNVPQKLLDVYETGRMLGEATGNHQSALVFFTKRAAIKDSLLTIEKSRAVYDLQIKYESEEKEKENQRLQYVNALKTVEKEQAESDKRFFIIGSIAVIVLMSSFFVLLYRNKKIKNKLAEEQLFTKAIMEGEQNERIRVARDLHDSIGQMLSVAKMNLSTLHYELPENKMAANSADLLDKALVELRNISQNLMPEDLNFGLFQAIENICDEISTAGKIAVVLDVPDEIKHQPFEKNKMLTIYRIVQEVLNNMVKHSEANQINIKVESMAQHAISISITDNGKGFDTNAVGRSQGHGWKNIAARVRMLDGKMQVRSAHLKGTQIEIIIPVA